MYHFQQYVVTNKYRLVLLLSSRHVHCTYLCCNYIVIRQAQTRDSVKSHYFTRQSMTSSIWDPRADYTSNNINNKTLTILFLKLHISFFFHKFIFQAIPWEEIRKHTNYLQHPTQIWVSVHSQQRCREFSWSDQKYSKNIRIIRSTLHRLFGFLSISSQL